MSIFTKVPMKRPQTNTFKIPYSNKFTTQFGKLVPVFVKEVIPGDRWTISNQTLIRFAPLISPVMHKIKVYTHYFFVPNRIIFPEWEKFISSDLSKDVPPAWPFFNLDSADAEPSTLGDYLGVPSFTPPNGERLQVSAIPFAAYHRIWYEYYRDQNLIEADPIELVPGDNGTDSLVYSELTQIRYRAWHHDYFTSALPFAQKGPAVDIPVDGFAEVGVTSTREDFDTGPSITIREGSTSMGGASINHLHPDDYPDLDLNRIYAEFSDGGGINVESLRVALRLQEWFEKAARGGTRYIEQLHAHFGVTSSNKLLQRPQFLGGNINNAIISEVLQTSSSDDTTPQANMAGHGIAGSHGKRITYFAEEHGYLIGIQSIMPMTGYFQGLPRHFTRKSWEEYAWPTFAHLGEQAIISQEIYADGSADDQQEFGYIPRFSEYKYAHDEVHGDFRTTLDFWHMARKFNNRPQLNKDFIELDVERSEMNRIFAVQDYEHDPLWCDAQFDIRVNRRLPRFGIPAI